MKALPRKSHAFCLISVLAGVALPATLNRSAQAEVAPRYPYDPLCPWGRLADGHGMILRCIEPTEASALSTRAAAASAGSASASERSASEPGASEPGASEPGASEPGASEPGAAEPGAAAANAAEPRAAEHGAEAANAAAAKGLQPRAAVALTAQPSAVPSARPASVTQVGPLAVDTGELPSALSELKKPKQRYADCVNQNGGLSARNAQVQIRFLVRELGRAEGVSVKDYKGLSLLAAKCIAGVIDRRNVGYPEAPIVGATLTIDLEPTRAQ